MFTLTETQIIKYLSTSQNRLNLVLRLLEKRSLELLNSDHVQLKEEVNPPPSKSPDDRAEILMINLLEELSDQILGISRYLTILESPESRER